MKPGVEGYRKERGATPAPLQDKDGAARVCVLLGFSPPFVHLAFYIASLFLISLFLTSRFSHHFFSPLFLAPHSLHTHRFSQILHPVWVGLTSEFPPPHGVLYQNYQVVPWN
jgi:hypothetical protein